MSVCHVHVRFRIEQPVYINIIRDPINRFLSNYFFRRFGDWRGEQNHLIRTPGMKDDERYLVRKRDSFFSVGLLRLNQGSSKMALVYLTHSNLKRRIYGLLSQWLRSFFPLWRELIATWPEIIHIVCLFIAEQHLVGRSTDSTSEVRDRPVKISLENMKTTFMVSCC